MAENFPAANFQYRDSLFRDYFKDRHRLLALCNALLDANYSDANEVEINTLGGNFFNVLKNDISCKIGDQFLILVEHQSTVNNNLPPHESGLREGKEIQYRLSDSGSHEFTEVGKRDCQSERRYVEPA